MWSNQETSVRKQVENPCEAERYAMHSSGKNSLAAGLSPYKIAKMDAFASKLAGRLFSPFCMACSVHKIFTKELALTSWLVWGGSCGVRARKALFYKAFAGSYFLSGSVKNRHFLRKWCSKWCSKIVVEVKKQKIEKTSEKSLCLIKLIL